jgi:hypothetical protein
MLEIKELCILFKNYDFESVYVITLKHGDMMRIWPFNGKQCHI